MIATARSRDIDLVTRAKLESGTENKSMEASINQFKKLVQNKESEVLRRMDKDGSSQPKRMEVPPINKNRRLVPEVVMTSRPRDTAVLPPKPRQEPLPVVDRPQVYKLKAPLESDEVVEKMLDQLLETTVTLELKTLLGTCPPLRDLVRAMVTRHRVTKKQKLNQVSMLDALELEPDNDDDQEVTKLEARQEIAPLVRVELPDIGCTFSKGVSGVPDGSIVILDPVQQFLQSHQGAAMPTFPAVAESQVLRTVFPLVNKCKHVEALLDAGSQIVSMSKAVALDLGITWDPDVKIKMQSANGSMEMSEGLAKYVPFVFGDIKVYLHVHVIDKAAYQIILGRPFDVLTESVVQNERSGGQLVTIKDPSNGMRRTMPTYARGQTPPEASSREPKEDEKPVHGNF